MTNIDLDKVTFASMFAGLGNYDEVSLAIPVPAQTLDGTAIPADIYFVEDSVAITRSYAVSQVTLQFTGLDTNYYRIAGGKSFYYDSSDNRHYNPLTAEYELRLWSYFEASSYKFALLVTPVDFTDSSIPIPAFTVNVSVRLFLPPFETV